MFSYQVKSRSGSRNSAVLSRKESTHNILARENKNSPGDLSSLINTKRNSSLADLISRSNIQPKLEIGKPNDPYEQEADKMAEKVVNNPQTNSHDGIKRKEEEKKEPAQAKVQL